MADGKEGLTRDHQPVRAPPGALLQRLGHAAPPSEVFWIIFSPSEVKRDIYLVTNPSSELQWANDFSTAGSTSLLRETGILKRALNSWVGRPDLE